MNQLM